MMKCSIKEVIMVALSFFFTFACDYVFAGEWQKPWAAVEAAASQRCAKTFEAYQLQSVCMENEKNGHEKMQSDFGMPSSIASKAKERCAKTFQPFQLQAVCMENEKAGYDKMNAYNKKDIQKKSVDKNNKRIGAVKETAEEPQYEFEKPQWKRFATKLSPPYDYYEYDSAPKNILQGAVNQNREHTVVVMTRHMEDNTVQGMFQIAINCTKMMAMVIDAGNYKMVHDTEPITEDSIESLLYGNVCEPRKSERESDTVNTTSKGIIKVSSDKSESGIIDGASIRAGGSLNLTGICKGDIEVNKGGHLLVTGIVNGIITNNGGIVEINGTASTVMTNAGSTTISGVANHVTGKGKVIKIRGAVIDGKRVK
jgi:hypothetical protein